MYLLKLVTVLLAIVSLVFHFIRLIISNLYFQIGAAWYYGTCVRGKIAPRLGRSLTETRVAVTMGKYGCHLWDISIAHTMSNEFIIVRGFHVTVPKLSA